MKTIKDLAPVLTLIWLWLGLGLSTFSEASETALPVTQTAIPPTEASKLAEIGQPIANGQLTIEGLELQQQQLSSWMGTAQSDARYELFVFDLNNQR